MNREFLEQYGIGQEAMEAILAESEREAEAHARQMQELRFDHALNTAIAEMHGRSAVAIRAMLDLDSLKAGGDIQAALEALKKENGYLFEEPVAGAYSAGAGTGCFRRGYSREEIGRMSMAEYKAYRQGR